MGIGNFVMKLRLFVQKQGHSNDASSAYRYYGYFSVPGTPAAALI